MKTRKRQDPPDSDHGPASVLPGQRSGEGAKDLFRHIEGDMRRNAGLPPKKPRDPKQS